MSTVLVLNREEDTYRAVVIKDREQETTIVKSVEQLKDLYLKYRPKRSIYLLWPEQAVSEILTLPLTRRSEIPTALEFAMEDELPLSSDNYEFLYTVIKKQNDSTLVLASAILKEPFKKEITYLQNGGVLINEARFVVGEVLQWCLQNVNENDFICVVKIKDSYLLTRFKDRVPLDIKVSTNRSFMLLELEKLRRSYNCPVYWAAENPPEGANHLAFDISAIYRGLNRRHNLIHRWTSRDTKEEKLKTVFYFTLVLAMVLHLTGSFVPFIKTYTMVSTLKNRIANYREVSSSLLKEISSVERHIEFLQNMEGLLKRGTGPALALQRLSEVLPEDVELERLRLQDQKIELAGYARDTVMVLNALKKSGQFRDINSITTSSDREGLERFIMKMEFIQNE